MEYAFILGRTKELSIAELGAFFGKKMVIGRDSTYALYNGGLPAQTPQAFLNRLGGTTEIVEVFAPAVSVAAVEKTIEEYLKNVAQKQTGKLAFGVSELPEKKQSRLLKFLLPRLKKNLRAAGISASFMNKDFRNVSDVFASKNGLVEHGTNVRIIDIGEGRVSLGFSAAIQDIDAYSKRDFSKPFRDARVGMLPPKLAQIMINLCHCERNEAISKPTKIASAHSDGPRNDTLIYDPFCGTGTILMEALLMGHWVIGSDADMRMSDGATKNIEWLRKNFPITSTASSTIFTKSAAEISRNDLPGQIGLSIVTEPLLGPPLSALPSPSQLQKITNELSSLYLSFFKNATHFLSAGSPVVFIFPAWKKNKFEYVSLAEQLIPQIKKMEFNVVSLTPTKISLIYDRPDQVVAREVTKFLFSPHG